MDTRSPIERMIDEACGVKPGTKFRGPVNPLVQLRCPRCNKTMQVPMDDTDPPGTAVVEVVCPDCDRSGEFEQVFYFRADGSEILEHN